MANKPKRLRCYVQTLPGVEEVAWLEIRDRFSQAHFVETMFAKDEQGMAVFDYGGNLADLQQLRTAEAVYLQALFMKKVSRGRQDLRQIRTLVAEGDSFGQAANAIMRYRAFSRPPSYSIVSHKVGEHQYKLRELTQAVLGGMTQRLPRWTPVAQGGEVEVDVNLLGSRLLIGLRLSDRMMGQRYARHTAPQPEVVLRPSLAAALVQLTNPQPDEVFLDPLCGSGMILRERHAFGNYRQLLGGDVAAAQARAAWKNLRDWKQRQQPAGVVVQQWDAAALPLARESIHKAATYLPDSAMLGANPMGLYVQVLRELSRVLVSGGRAVLLSSEYDVVKEAMRQVPHLAIESGYSVLVNGRWHRLYIATPGG